MTEASLESALGSAAAVLEKNPPLAESRAREILKVAPHEVRAGLILGRALRLQGKLGEARTIFTSLLAASSAPAEAFYELSAIFNQTGDLAAVQTCLQQAIRRHPREARGWMLYGNLLKTRGEQSKCIAAYREAIRQAPDAGIYYWSLANLKTVAFTPDDVARMLAQVSRDNLSADDRLHFEFALGKALEDANDPAAAFEHYRKANELRRQALPYDADETHAFVERLKQACSADLFRKRAGLGSAASDPIFVVGLPRSGSTLVEQILASHSMVEGTKELRDVAHIAAQLGSWNASDPMPTYPEVLSKLADESFAVLGDTYLARTRMWRKSGRPHFVDKMPNNFLHIGLIHLMLPNARIIDVRRHPMACGLSCYKQHFATGQAFLYDLADIGRFYADYAGLMDHHDAALPGRVHRVFYEKLVEDPEDEIRRLLTHCALPFEENCLRFHETVRNVQTASSEQVRRPIYADGVDDWQRYEPWLGPLKVALGPVLERYPT